MASLLNVNSSVPAHHFALSRQFFIAWQQRNASRQELWSESPTDQGPVLAQTTTHLRFDSLQNKIQRLKSEIVSLIAQDMALFQQLFALQEAILEFREQLENCQSSSESSPSDSPCSTLSSLSSSDSDSKWTRQSASFVRQQVSYPPIKCNRARRTKARSPHHVCQDSYDSGIHTSDHEIFV